ncbi:MAG: hypothetical protein LBV12_03235, partial [Puniceicoccales bacterium]|nr:hypothetical protein [Puniceicoccales bacterium]
MPLFRISLLTLAFSAFFSPIIQAADTASDWAKYEEAKKNALPKSAITALDPIIEKTLADGTYDEALKAILLKAAQVTAIDGNNMSAQIRELRAYFDKAPAQLKPMLATALAHAWQSYYNQNRWQLLRRSASSAGDSTDFLTWDATRVRSEIDSLYTFALGNAAALKRTPVATFNAVLKPGSLPDAYRPTLYDFLIHDAIAFYSLGEQGASQPEDAFEPEAKSPLLGTLEEFLAWKPQTTDTASPKLKVIQLYQEVLRFHKNDTLALALSDADFQRILWAGKILDSSENIGVQGALHKFIERWKNYE